MDIPVYVIAYNNLYYVRQMVRQLEKYTSNIHVVDNASTYPPLLEYYQQEYKHHLISMSENRGPRVMEELPDLPTKYIMTDPDLLFNPNLPINFIQQLSDLADKYQASRVGFALDLSDAADFVPGIYHLGFSIYDWEKRFWDHPVIDPDYTLYEAIIDTTFTLVNRIEYDYQLRVGGNFTCKHLPWYKQEWITYPNDELVFYRQGQGSTIINLIFPEITIQKREVEFKLPLNGENKAWWPQHYQTWEEETFRILDHYLRVDQDFMDIGTWIGPLALYALQKCRHVYAVECDKNSIFELMTAVRLNNAYDRVTLIDQAIYDTDNAEILFGPNKFVPQWDQLNQSVSQIRTDKIELTKYDYIVKTITFATLMARYSQANMCLIKVDIEGAEEFLLEEAIEHVLTVGTPLVISFHVPWWSKRQTVRGPPYGKTKIMTDQFHEVTENQFVDLLGQNGFATFIFERRY